MPDFNLIINNLHNQSLIAIDEAGRGCLAGPVVAACVLISQDSLIQWQQDELLLKIKDSKKLSAKTRLILYNRIINFLPYGIGEVCAQSIDSIGIIKATSMAMEKAIENCLINPINPRLVVASCLLDGPLNLVTQASHPQLCNTNMLTVVRGDNQCYAIAAASILAKVHRDTLMENLHLNSNFTKYHFNKHKGYGTLLHLQMLQAHGLSSQHRLYFCKNFNLNKLC